MLVDLDRPFDMGTADSLEPGQILISPRVLMAVKEAVTVEAVGEFELKGIRRPVATYNVVAAVDLDVLREP